MNEPVTPAPVRYCQFGKRLLDGFGWIAPVTNNRLGDALNIEFVHEHLFLIEGDRRVEKTSAMARRVSVSARRITASRCTRSRISQRTVTGSSDVRIIPRPPATRSHNRTTGTTTLSLATNARTGPTVLRKRIERVEKERGLPLLGADVRAGEDAKFWREKPPTVPGSAWLALVAIALGIGSCLAPAVAAERSVWVLAAFLIISGIADISYAFRDSAWSQLLSTVFFALLNLGAGVALLLDTTFVANWAGGLFGIALAVNGAAHVVVALRSRPIRQWFGSLLTGLGMLIGAILLFNRTVGQRDAVFGIIIGFNLLLGGASTLWLPLDRRARIPIFGENGA